MKGATFHPVDPVRAVYDLVLDKPVLLLGTWHDAAGQHVGTEVSTMTQTRSPAHIREILTPKSVSVIVPAKETA